MKTQCTGEQLEFHALGRRQVTGRFDGGRISSDAGGVLLREVDKRTGVTARVSACFADHRNPASVEHSVRELVSQRIYGIALGYEDLNDHGELRDDALLSLLVGKRDATDDPLHGHQEGRFFHGYYGCYCYLPLYIFCGEHLLCARLRPSDRDASAGSIEELSRIVGRIRRRWPKTRIHIRGDSGFCRESIMAWCEEQDVGYVLGLARTRCGRTSCGCTSPRSPMC